MSKRVGRTTARLLCVVAFMLCVFGNSAFAGTAYYLSPSGSDENAGTKDSPLFNLQKAITLMNGGDTLWVKGGTYSYTATVVVSNKKGTADSRYLVLAVPGEKPVFDFATWVPSSSDRGNARGMLVDSTAYYWYFKGLQFSNAPDNGVKLEGAYCTFDQCIFDHNGDSGLQIGTSKDDRSTSLDPEHQAAYNLIINCDAYRNVDPGTEYENADGFACKCYAGKGNVFYGCRAWENCDDGWDCYQTEYEIGIVNCWAWHNGDPTFWGMTSFNGDGNCFKLGGNGVDCPIRITNCIGFNGGCIGDGGAGHGFNDNNNSGLLTILNCVAWKCVYDFKVASPAPVIKNCVAFDPTQGAQYTFAKIPSDATFSNNTYCETDETGPTASAADFVDTSEASAAAARESDGGLPKNGFGRLKSSSTLIDKGVDVGIAYSGSAPDLGAYEIGKELPTIPDGVFIIPNSGTTSIRMVSNSSVKTAKLINQQLINGKSPSLRFSAANASVTYATIRIVDALGKEVATVFSGKVTVGETYTVKLPARCSKGAYFSVVKAGQYETATQLTL